MIGNNALLQVCQVSASRPGESGKPQRILKNITLAVAAGEVLAVVGPSGSGKSSLLRLLNRLLEPDQGEILLAGEDIKHLPPPVLRARVPLVGQKPFLFPGTVWDNLKVPAKFRRTKSPDLDDPKLFDLFALCKVDPTWLDRDAHKLSVGQQQRICLARAMLAPCQVLLLDEPTSALDRPTADQMALTFRQLASEKNLAIVFVTHDLRLTERSADRVAFLMDGVVVEQGDVRQLFKSPKTPEVRRFLTSELSGDEGMTS